MIVNWLTEGNLRRPNLPEGVDFTVLSDNGETCEVEIFSANWPPRTYKSDIWRRAVDHEAEVIDDLLRNMPIRLQRLWADSEYLSHVDELWLMVTEAAKTAFGPVRAAVLLAPS